MFRGREYFIRTIKSNPLHSIFLFVPIAVLAILLFGGFVIDMSLQKGMDNLERRLGADIMLVPEGAEKDAQNMILEGARGSFYFDKSIYEKVSSISDIEEVTAQLFLKSLSAECCSSEVEIVFFDPKTDFMIGPWISKEYKQKLKKDRVVIGHSIDSAKHGKIKLFGKEYTVAGKMAKTGTSLDKSVYFSFDSFGSVIANAEKKGSFLTDNQKNQDVISSVFINMKEGHKTEEIIEKCRLVAGESFEVVYPRQIAESLSLNLKGIYTGIHLVLITGGVLLLFVLFIINIVIANERKREAAVFRIFGVTKKKVAKLFFEEVIFLSVLGAIAGCLLSTLFVIPFGNYIGVTLEMPYLGPDFLQIILLYVMIVFIVILIAAVSSIFPVIYISNMEPYIALRKEGE